MKTTTLAALVFGLCASLSAQDFAGPKPTKNHELLKQFEGTWDAQAKFFMEPGKPPDESKGEEVSKISCNGLWLIFSYKGKMGPIDFEGHGQLGYDEKKGKFVSCWVDSMITALDLGEGTADASGKTFTMTSEVAGPDGKPMKMKQLHEFKGADTRVMTISAPGPDGKDATFGVIEYKRRK